MKADKLLQKAFAIASKEQVVAIARAHLLFEKGEKQTAEKILDSAVAMKDDGTGEPLMKRSDDTEEALRKRLVAFHSQTKPVVDYYSKQGLYAPIDANQKADTVKAAIAKIVAGC